MVERFRLATAVDTHFVGDFGKKLPRFAHVDTGVPMLLRLKRTADVEPLTVGKPRGSF